MTLDQYWNGLVYTIDRYKRRGLTDPDQGEKEWANYIRRNSQQFFAGRCPLCHPVGTGPSVVEVPGEPQWPPETIKALVDQGVIVREGDLRSYYLWPASSLYFKSLRGAPRVPGLEVFTPCGHLRSAHIFLDFQGHKPNFERLKALGFPYLNPEVPFLIPYLLGQPYEIDGKDWEGNPIRRKLGGMATIVQGKLPDPWSEAEVAYTIVSTFFGSEKMPDVLHPVWDHMVGEGSGPAPFYHGDTFPVKNYIHPFTGALIPLEAWYDWKPWVEAGLVTWWDQTKPGRYEERSRDWDTFPLKDLSGRRRILHLRELERFSDERDFCSSPRAFETWDEVMAFYETQDYDNFDEQKIRKEYRSLGHSIFGGDE